MASKSQVQKKAERLGGSLKVDHWSAELLAPKGKLFDGLHYSKFYFGECDSRQEVWDSFWEEMKSISDCDCGC